MIIDDLLHNLKIGSKTTLDIYMIQVCLKFILKTTVSCLVLLKFTPNFVSFLVHTCKAITWFCVTDIKICHDWTLDNMVPFDVISCISFHL